MANVYEYIGKRVHWTELERVFPNHKVLYTDAEYDGNDVTDITSATVTPLYICKHNERTTAIFSMLGGLGYEVNTATTGEGEIILCPK